MSAVSLVTCVLGNALLVVRFSSNAPSVKALVVEAPLVAFWIKTIVEVVNLAIYGHRGGVGSLYYYSQGFWSAVFSCGLSGLVALLLSFHWLVQRNKEWKDSIKVRIDGRHFMLSVTTFVLVIALMALVFSKIEGWSYVTGIFFSIVSTLTVGFGASRRLKIDAPATKR
jgi:potassium channel subfamily K